MQATDAKLATATETLMISTAAKMKAKSKEFKSSKAHAINITGSKMCSTPQLEQHHRINQSPLSLESGLGTENLTAELKKKVIHRNRALHSPIQKAEQMKAKINFPPSNSKLWDKVNTELENIIPINFPDSLFKKLSTSEISQRFDDWLHQFFLQSFGEKKKVML